MLPPFFQQVRMSFVQLLVGHDSRMTALDSPHVTYTAVASELHNFETVHQLGWLTRISRYRYTCHL